jgi:hypothetical protein
MLQFRGRKNLRPILEPRAQRITPVAVVAASLRRTGRPTTDGGIDLVGPVEEALDDLSAPHLAHSYASNDSGVFARTDRNRSASIARSNGRASCLSPMPSTSSRENRPERTTASMSMKSRVSPRDQSALIFPATASRTSSTGPTSNLAGANSR